MNERVRATMDQILELLAAPTEYGDPRDFLCQLVREARAAALEEAAVYVASAPLGCSIDSDELADDIRELIDNPDYGG